MNVGKAGYLFSTGYSKGSGSSLSAKEIAMLRLAKRVGTPHRSDCQAYSIAKGEE